jgi:hypothetical protein
MAGCGAADDSNSSQQTPWQLRRKPQMLRKCELEKQALPAAQPGSAPEPEPEPAPAPEAVDSASLPEWCVAMVREIGLAAASKQKTALLLDALAPVPARLSRVWGVKPGHPALPAQAVAALHACETAAVSGDGQTPLPQHAPPQAPGPEERDAFDAYELASPPVWVAADDADGVVATRAALQALLAGHGPGR